MDVLAELFFLFLNARDRIIFQHALGVAQRAHNQRGVQFRRADQRLFDVLVHRCFFGGDKARAHIDAVSTQRQSGDQLLGIADAARGDKRNGQFFGCARQQNHVRNIIFTGVTAALKAVNRYGIATNALGFQRVAHRGAFVNDFNTGLFQQRHILLGAATGGFNNAHATGDNRFDIARIIRIGEARQEGQVHTERLVGHVIAFGDFIGQIFRRLLRQAGNDAEATGV